MKTSTFIRAIMASIFLFLAQPAWAVPQEGTPDPGEGLTALETTMYFVLAPLGLFLTIVVIAYSVHRPREGKNKPSNVLTEIR